MTADAGIAPTGTMSAVKGQNGGDPTGPDMVKWDINTDGAVNLIDMSAVKNMNGGSASCP